METKYFMIIGGQQVGPIGLYEMRAAGLTPDTPVWREGLADWVKASTLVELNEVLGPVQYGVPPRSQQYPPQQPPRPGGYNMSQGNYTGGQYGNQFRQPAPAESPIPSDRMQQFENNGLPIAHTNWLPWAITGTVLGVLFCFIGMIFGIIAIVNANKANKFYNEGNGMMGDSVNSTARTNSIISLVLGGLGIPISLLILGDALATLTTLGNL